MKIKVYIPLNEKGYPIAWDDDKTEIHCFIEKPGLMDFGLNPKERIVEATLFVHKRKVIETGEDPYYDYHPTDKELQR